MKSEKHIIILGILYIVFSGLLLIPAFGALHFGKRIWLAWYLIVVYSVGIIGGIGLLKRQPWARITVLIIAFLNFFCFPWGIIPGIYAIWVLMKRETARIFAARSNSEEEE